MTEEIWNDIKTRLRDVRVAMIGQWQGDIDNRGMEQTISLLGNVLVTWELVKPPGEPPQSPL